MSHYATEVCKCPGFMDKMSFYVDIIDALVYLVYLGLLIGDLARLSLSLDTDHLSIQVQTFLDNPIISNYEAVPFFMILKKMRR